MRMTKAPALATVLLAGLALAACREAAMPLPPAPPVPAEVVEAPAAAPPADGEFVPMAGVCNIESINDQSGEALDSPVRVSGRSVVSGWRALVSGEGAMAPAWLRATRADGSVAFQVRVPATEDRPDVASLIGKPASLRSGFRHVAVEGLAPGSVTLEIIFGSGDGWVRCAHARELVVE